jgi:hypothetical protein
MTKLNMEATNKKIAMNCPIVDSVWLTGCAKIFHPMSKEVSWSPAARASSLHHAQHSWLRPEHSRPIQTATQHIEEGWRDI